MPLFMFQNTFYFGPSTTFTNTLPLRHGLIYQEYHTYHTIVLIFSGFDVCTVIKKGMTKFRINPTGLYYGLYVRYTLITK